jgi:hypothetical protein
MDQADRQRILVRAVMERAGCFKCGALVTERGRNSNTYGCRHGGCDKLREADKFAAEEIRKVVALRKAEVSPGPAAPEEDKNGTV